MQLSAYLFFKGNCEEAFKYYEKHLGGKIEVVHTYGTAPMDNPVSPEWRDKIMHANMTVGGTLLMGSDAPPERQQTPQGFSMSLGTKDIAEAERWFQVLSENGKVQMPIQQTFWAKRFAMLTDQFGVPWMINCD